jgi:hypothetical protein
MIGIAMRFMDSSGKRHETEIETIGDLRGHLEKHLKRAENGSDAVLSGFYLGEHKITEIRLRGLLKTLDGVKRFESTLPPAARNLLGMPVPELAGKLGGLGPRRR